VFAVSLHSGGPDGVFLLLWPAGMAAGQGQVVGSFILNWSEDKTRLLKRI